MDAGAGRQLDGRQGAGKEGVSAQQGREGHLVKGLDSTWFQFMGLPCSTCADVLWWAAQRNTSENSREQRTGRAGCHGGLTVVVQSLSRV